MKENEYRKLIQEAIAPFGATLLELVYSRRFFGNITLKIVDANKETHEYTLDRGDIYVGSILFLAHNEYNLKIKEHFFDKLVQCIIQDLSLFKK